MTEFVVDLGNVRIGDIADVGGKNASLGEMIAALSPAGVRVPGGYATTARAFQHFLASTGADRQLKQVLDGLDVSDISALAAAGKQARELIGSSPLPTDLVEAIRDAHGRFGDETPVAVRSSATAEDLPEASFAGQQETLLNIRGTEAVIAAIHEVFASLFTDRAIAYRTHHGFDHHEVALSVGVQQMVESDASGVAFSLDTESGFADTVFITAAYGLGELVVQGAIDPDEFYVYKPNLEANRPAILQRSRGRKRQRMVYGDSDHPVRTEDVDEAHRNLFSITDEEVELLARHVVAIERHYAKPVDVEWAKDRSDGMIYILQARPETVQSQSSAQIIERFRLVEAGRRLITGRSVGQRIGTGVARIVGTTAEMESVAEGDVLVTDMTDPDWEPIMKRAAAIVTNRGGRTCHAAIVARELGIPAVVGTGDGTSAITDGEAVTVSCAEGDTGVVYSGLLDYVVDRMELDAMPEPPTRIMMNVGNPERALAFSRIPNHGVGLARVEFIINSAIGVHPQALVDYQNLDGPLRDQISEKISGYGGPTEFFVTRLREGVATIAAAFAPKPVIVRLSDFKSNEYAHLLGGDRYEPVEQNPMIGFRGASRYRDPSFGAAFALECRALREVREDMGLTNLEVMIPFVRTLGEAREVVDILASHGIRRGENGLRLIMMCEIPSNALLASDYLELFDGFSIGSNDLTQFTLALDRDSELVAGLFNERDPAVKQLIRMAIDACHAEGKYIGICGQGPSDHPDFAEWLVDNGIDSLSLNPDTVVETWLQLASRTSE